MSNIFKRTLGELTGSRAAEKASEASERATMASIAEQRRQYDLARSDMAPWMAAGQGALSELTGYDPSDMTGWETSPGYQFRVDEANRALGASTAARGQYSSGNTLAALARLNQGLASEEYDKAYGRNVDRWNRLSSLAGVGQSTASGMGQLGANFASGYGNAMMNNAATQGNAALAANAGFRQLLGSAMQMGGASMGGGQPSQNPYRRM